MEQLIERLVTSNLTWATALVIISIVLRPVLTGALDIMKENIKTRREMESDRLDIEREQTRVLSGLKDELVISRGISNQLISGITAIPSLINTGMERMETSVALADAKRDLIHADLKAIPAEVWRLGEPRIADLRKELASNIEKLQLNVEAWIAPTPENTRQAIRTEFEAVMAKLADIQTALVLTQQAYRVDIPKPNEEKP